MTDLQHIGVWTLEQRVELAKELRGDLVEALQSGGWVVQEDNLATDARFLTLWRYDIGGDQRWNVLVMIALVDVPVDEQPSSLIGRQDQGGVVLMLNDSGDTHALTFVLFERTVSDANVARRIAALA